MEIFVNLLLLCSDSTRKWVMYSQSDPSEMQEDYYVLNDKSLKFKVTIDSKLL